MENINGKSRANFRWVFSCAAMGLAVSASLCFAQENQNASRETATVLAAIIAAVSAIAAVVGAVVASKSARVAMKSAVAAMMSAQKKDGRTLVPLVNGIVNKKIDWARTFVEAVDTPFGTVLTILLSIALGVGFNILLSRSDSPSALVPASDRATPASTAPLSAPPRPASTAAPASTAPVPAPPRPASTAGPASTAPVSAPPRPASTAGPASTAPVSAPPRPASNAAAPDHNEVAALLARGRAHLSDGDVALARVFLRRAADRDDPQAALALGGTYDPAELKRLGIMNFHADAAQAQAWYRKAAEMGSTDAASRLEQLSNTRP